MRISIRHELRFAVPPNTRHAVQHLLLTPIDTPAQTVREWEILIPGIERAAAFFDAFGNSAHMVSQTRPETETLFITVSGVVETRETQGVLGTLSHDPLAALFKRMTPQTRPNAALVADMQGQRDRGVDAFAVMEGLMTTLHDAHAPATQSARAADDFSLEIVASDHANVFVAAARGFGLPARFVTGYVLDTPDRPARLHAWAEVFVAEQGWVGFDPYVKTRAGAAHVRLACGLDAHSASPVRRVPDYAPDGPEAVDIMAEDADFGPHTGQPQQQH